MAYRYVTTTLPYVNSDPHVGFAMEIVRADALVRYFRAQGDTVFFNTGTDEHGAKIYENAVGAGKDPQAYVDVFAEKFKELTHVLNIGDVHFIRTTDEKHVRAAEAMWQRCHASGDIYKKIYKTKYCVGCELEKTESELVDGKCPIHPNRDIEVREEENYFFRWSNYQKKLLALYEARPDFVVPDFRGNEIRAFVDRGLEDFSISRLKSKMPWGVPVPGDEAHVMYVWFDALTSYISTLGWPACATGVAGRPGHHCGEDESDACMFTNYWANGEPIQYCGKDNNRQQSAMWQAMLMSAGLSNSAHIVIDGFITSGGQKMSKSQGNVINPFDVVSFFAPYTPFPEDVLRFVLLHDIPSFEDGDLTMDSIKASYVANLQNGLGNLVSRIMKMATTYGVKFEKSDLLWKEEKAEIEKNVQSYDFHGAMWQIEKSIGMLDVYIQTEQPFKKIKTNEEEAKTDVRTLLSELHGITEMLMPFLPNTASEIKRLICEHKMPEKPLFNRLP